MVKSSKRIKPSSKDGIDRISNLPEALISKILSLLPTENAVATSVLSTKWKLLWTSITSLNFDEQTICSRPKKGRIYMKRTKFTVFVSRVFMLITLPCVQKFRFICTHLLFDPYHLNLWITLIAPTVIELDLQLDLKKGKSDMFHLCMNHFHFSKLVVLKLKGCVEFKTAAQASILFPNLRRLYLFGIRFAIDSNSSFSFPKLKFLRLISFDYENEESVHKLLSSCPILHSLLIDIRDWKDLARLVICIPSLRRLSIGLWCCSGDRVHEIQIDKLHKLKYLLILGHALKAISASSANISSDFSYLKRLDLEVHDCRECCVVIKNLLGNMDNLKHLELTRGPSCSCSQKSWWIKPLNAPKCLLSRVTNIFFELTKDDCRDELELVRYFLKNAKVLQMFKLFTQPCSSERKRQVTEKISKFPKGSHACQVEFT